MKRTALILVVALSLTVAGCLGGGSGSTESPATPAATDGMESPPRQTTAQSPVSTTTQSPENTTASPSQGNVSVSYSVSQGSIPEEITSVSMTMRVVFVEHSADYSRNACWADTYYGPYKPTPTPIGKADGDCHRTDTVTLDLTDVNGSRSLGEFSAPARFSAGHGLILTEVTATYENGTSVTGVVGEEGHRLSRQNAVDGSYQFTLSLEPWSVDGVYAVVSEVEPVADDS